MKRICFIGSGNMAESMAQGLITRGNIEPMYILASGPRPERGAELTARHGILTCQDNLQAVCEADVVVLAVKPQMIASVLVELKGHIPEQALVISIAAGVSLAQITEGLAHNRVIRAMPNTPAAIGAGVTMWIPTEEVDVADREVAEQILGACGHAIGVSVEDYLNIATAVSGSGVTMLWMVVQAMVDAAVHMGLPRHMAYDLVGHTFTGADQYATGRGDVHLAQLCDNVTALLLLLGL